MLDKTAATIVDKYAAPLAFLETESTRRRIKRQLSPTFVEGETSLHRLTSAKVLAELEKLSETLSKVEQDFKPGTLERIDVFKLFSPVIESLLGGSSAGMHDLSTHADIFMPKGSHASLGKLGPPEEERKKQQKRTARFDESVKKYKAGEKEMLETFVAAHLSPTSVAVLEGVLQWAVTAGTVHQFFDKLADCKQVWSGEFFHTWFKDAQTGPIKFFHNLRDGKYQKQWAAIRDAEAEFATAVGKMGDAGGDSLKEDLVNVRHQALKAVNAGMKVYRNAAGLACGIIWENVGMTNPVINAIAAWLKAANDHCPALVEEGKDFGVAVSFGLELDGGVTPPKLPVKISAAVGIEAGLGITSSGQKICFVGAAVSMSAQLAKEASVGASMSGNIIFFKDAGGITGTSNSAGFGLDMSVKLGAGVDVALGLNFGLNQFLNHEDVTGELMKKTPQDVIAHMMDWTDISLSVSAGVGFGIGGTYLPLSASFGYSWTPLCIDTNGMKCGFEAEKCDESDEDDDQDDQDGWWQNTWQKQKHLRRQKLKGVSTGAWSNPAITPEAAISRQADCNGYTQEQWDALLDWWKTQKKQNTHPDLLITDSVKSFQLALVKTRDDISRGVSRGRGMA